MSAYSIEAENREVTGKHVKYLRSAGQVPGIIYGPKADNTPVTFDARELDTVLAEAGGTSIIDVKVGKDTYQVLVRDVQRDILRGHPLHVDLYAADLEQTVRVEVPIVLVGESPIVASRAASMLQSLSSIEVEGLPQDLINEVNVDMEDLTEIGMSVSVGELYIPSNLTLITDPSELVVKIDYLALEEEEEEEEEEELMFEEGVEPEVIGRGAEDEEEVGDEEEY